jgi:transposase
MPRTLRRYVELRKYAVRAADTHLPSDLARERRSLCTMREQLVATHTALINGVRGWARTKLLKIRSGDWTTFPKRARDAALGRVLGPPNCLTYAHASGTRICQVSARTSFEGQRCTKIAGRSAA